jgi:cation:H+ antiporter
MIALDIISLVAALGMILFASMLFTNGVEFLGHRLGMHQGAVGGILAAVGTALPETIVPLIALFWTGGEAAKEVGVGAIVGAPFMLATLAMFVTGVAVFGYAATGRRSTQMDVHVTGLKGDLIFFLSLYGLAIAGTFIREIVWLRIGLAVVLLLSYGWYIRHTLRTDHEAVELPDKLWIASWLRLDAKTSWIVTQVVLALGIMIAGAHWFVGEVTDLASIIGMSPLILSMLITPIATELPEKMNSVLWIGRGRDVLALGNITGAMVFQSSFPVVLGMIATPWDLRGAPLVSAGIALAAGLWMLLVIRLRGRLSPWTLLACGPLYGLFIAYVVWWR